MLKFLLKNEKLILPPGKFPWNFSCFNFFDDLFKAVVFGSSIKLKNQINSFGGRNGNYEYPIQRLDLAEDGTIDQIKLIGSHDDYFIRHFCTKLTLTLVQTTNHFLIKSKNLGSFLICFQI